MSRIVFWAAVSALFLTSAVGCTICQNPDDCLFGAYGGVAPRADMGQGRVGSVFAPAEAAAAWTESVPTRDTEPNPAPATIPGAEEEPNLETSF